jgi:hypothetical protein
MKKGIFPLGSPRDRQTYAQRNRGEGGKANISMPAYRVCVKGGKVKSELMAMAGAGAGAGVGSLLRLEDYPKNHS